MVLVDTSVWIEVFRKPARLELTDEVALDDIVTCLPVVQEVLQGFRDDRAHALARQAMLAFPIVESPMEEGVFLEAAELYRAGRRKGVTIRSGVDCLVAACALRHGLEVLHRDRDFAALGRLSALRQRSIRA